MLSQTEFISQYTLIGAKKASDKAMRIFLLAVFAGVMTSFGAALSGIAAYSLQNSAAKLAGGLIFSFSLIMVIWAGAELFPGNCLIFISVLERKATAGGMFRNLAIVYFGNLVGTFMTAYLLNSVGYLDMGGGALAVYMIQTAVFKSSHSWIDAFVRGIGCNILICVAVMAATSTKDSVGKFVASLVPVATFVMIGLENSVANMYFVSLGILADMNPGYHAAVLAAGTDTSILTLKSFAVDMLVPVSLGNLAGGVAFAALMWYAHRPAPEAKN